MKLKEIDTRSSSILRIVFGAMWFIDAAYKWNLGFINSFTAYLTQNVQNQNPMSQAWVHLWVHGVGINVFFFAIFFAVAETAVAIGLVLGLFTEIAIYGGMAVVVIIWSTSQEFGVPYVAGSISIFTALIYEIVFILLLLGKSWRYHSIDTLIRKKMPYLYRHW